MAYYIIQHKNGCYWNGANWRRSEYRAKIYGYSELPDKITPKNIMDWCLMARRTDLRWRNNHGKLIAEAIETLISIG